MSIRPQRCRKRCSSGTQHLNDARVSCPSRLLVDTRKGDAIASFFVSHNKLQPPWIRADFTGICEPHWSRSTSRLHYLLEGVVAEALLHGMDVHCIKMAFQGILSDLAADRLGDVGLEELRAALGLGAKRRAQQDAAVKASLRASLGRAEVKPLPAEDPVAAPAPSSCGDLSEVASPQAMAAKAG